MTKYRLFSKAVTRMAIAIHTALCATAVTVTTTMAQPNLAQQTLFFFGYPLYLTSL